MPDRAVATDPGVFGDPRPNAVGRRALQPDDGCVIELDSRSAPRVIWSGEDLLSVRLPAGTRVVYAKPPIPGLPDREGAIRYALANPEGSDPLVARLRPGMKVTIAIDDVSLPLPKMRRPDIRESVLTVLLELLAEHGVSDVQIVVATAFHRPITPAEMEWLVGREIFRTYYPDRLSNHDAEAPGGMVELGKTGHGERVRLNRRAAESDLLIYVNVNLVPMDGGSKSVGVGLGDYGTLQAHHTPATIRASDSLMDHSRSALTASCDRIGRVINHHLNVFHVETVLNNRPFGPEAAFLAKQEDAFSPLDRVSFEATRAALARLPRPAKRRLLHSMAAPFEPIAIHAGETFAVHERTLAYCYAQYCVPVDGQADVMIAGIPYLSPYNVDSIMNPLLVQVMALAYIHHMYRGRPLVKKGGVMIVTHPLYDEFDPEQHPAYVEFFHRLLPETRDAFELQRRFEAEFAHDPGYRRLYSAAQAYHGVHPFYMWYWGEAGRAHVGKVIVVGAGRPETAARLGWDAASSIDEALAMAQSYLGRDPSVTLFHMPPIVMADLSGAPG
ncbi:MAG TPA: lactate racemase domain-containing protein [Chloroflexota bacterium]|nr:lactate racemase domain-containing protein [Chloroflexota bacterium]